MGNLIKNPKKLNNEDEVNKLNIKNLLYDYMNVLKRKNSNNYNTNTFTDSPFSYVKSKNILKQKETICLGLEFISDIFSQLSVKEVNLNLIQAGFIPKFSEGTDLTNDNEEIQRLKSYIKAWIDNDSNQKNYAILENIGELLPKPEDMPIFSEDISSINAKDSNNINTLSENGSYVEDDLISNSHIKNKKNEKNFGKKTNFNKKAPINKKMTFNMIPTSAFDKNKLIKSNTKANPFFNFLNNNKFKLDKASEQSSNIITKERLESEKNNNNTKALNNNEYKNNPIINDSKKTSNNNLGSSVIQLKSLNSDIKTPPIFSPKSPNLVKDSNTNVNKELYKRRITELYEDGEDDCFKSKEPKAAYKRFVLNKKKAMSMEKKVEIIPESINGQGPKMANLKSKYNSKRLDGMISPILTGSPKGKVLKYASAKMNKFSLYKNNKNVEIMEKELSNSDRVKIKNKTTKKQFNNNDESTEKKNIKYLKIDIRQLENEDKTTEESNSLPRPFSFEKMHLDQILTLQNMQRTKRADIENILRAVSKSPNHKVPNDMESLKNNILSTINHIQNSRKDSLNNSDDEEEDLSLKERDTTNNKFSLKSSNLLKNMVKKAMSSSSMNSFKFPKYQIDVSPLKLGDLPVDEVLKLLKTKNKFLFEETKEEKDLTSKIQKLTLESIEEN